MDSHTESHHAPPEAGAGERSVHFAEDASREEGSGFVYCATNPCVRYPHSACPIGLPMIKVGMTTRPVKERMGELQGSGVPSPWKVEATIESPYYRAIEKAMNSFLRAHPHSFANRVKGFKEECHPFPPDFGRKFFEVTKHCLRIAKADTRLFPRTTDSEALTKYYIETIKVGWSQWQQLSALSASDDLDLDVVDAHPQAFWDWDALSLHSHLTVEFVEKHRTRPWNWGWDGLSARDDLFSPEYIAAHPEFPWEIIECSGKFPVITPAVAYLPGPMPRVGVSC